ncbi:MAG TPA: hypothetical protein VE998_06670 [Terriglobales bacterium]|nr:hypothetical protein [Terriglobales bacterium]
MSLVTKIGDHEVRIGGRLVRIARLEAEKYLFCDDPEAIIARLKATGGADLFTFLQRVSEPQQKFSFPMEWDNFAAIPITSFEEWWNKQIGFKARNKAKQAEKKGIAIREVPFSAQLVRGIWEIYNETPVRQGRRFPHYGKDYDTVYREEATFLENSVFIGAYDGESLIGFIKLVHDQTKAQAGLMNIVSMLRHRDKAPTNGLVAHAVRACASRGIRHLVYSNFAYGKKQKSGLSDFKERNAFVRVDVPRYYVPLTARGAIALRLGMHRRLVDHLPESVMGRLRGWREQWYSRRFQSAEAL